MRFRENGYKEFVNGGSVSSLSQNEGYPFSPYFIPTPKGEDRLTRKMESYFL